MRYHDLQRDLYFPLDFSLSLVHDIVFVPLLFIVFKADLPRCIFGMTGSLNKKYHNSNKSRDGRRGEWSVRVTKNINRMVICVGERE